MHTYSDLMVFPYWETMPLVPLLDFPLSDKPDTEPTYSNLIVLPYWETMPLVPLPDIPLRDKPTSLVILPSYWLGQDKY